jgi:AraC-like DNA-binding protein
LFDILDYYGDQIIRQVTSTDSAELLTTDVAKIIELDVTLNDNVNKNLPLPKIDEMAKMTNMSPTKLKSLFKKMYNQTISDYFSSCRLSAARDTLLNSNISIKEVSYKFGYKSVQHFTTAFKNQFGESPAALQKL